MLKPYTPRPLSTCPTVSIIIPCYNYGRYLPVCVESALSQESVRTNIVIVDDASPDGSVSIARRLAASDSRIQVIEHRENRGHISTYNEGLRNATGDYVVLLSADDLLAPGSLARSAALLEAHHHVGFVYGYAPRFTDQPPAARTQPRSWTIWHDDEWLRRICRRGSNVIFNPEVVMRTELMRQLKGYDPRLPHAADFHLWMRAAAKAPVGRVNGCDQAYYRVHEQNMHLVKYAGVVTDITERWRAFEFFFAEYGRLSLTSNTLLLQVRRSLAQEALRLVCQSYSEPTLTTEQRTALVGFAQEICPQIGGGRLWRSCEHRAARRELGKKLSVSQRVDSTLDELAFRVRWHRWRRYGI